MATEVPQLYTELSQVTRYQHICEMGRGTPTVAKPAKKVKKMVAGKPRRTERVQLKVGKAAAARKAAARQATPDTQPTAREEPSCSLYDFVISIQDEMLEGDPDLLTRQGPSCCG